ncbi:MAG: septation protein A [Legionella sp.]|jgi:intracellular septation protein|nr:septation protein A [Legionella sp.]
MKLLFDFFPILIFFLCYKWFDIYTATAAAMVLSVIQVIFFRLKYQRYEKLHLISLVLICVLGGATLIFHDPWFIKWKPTVIYWLSALVFFGSVFIGKKPVIQKIMEHNIFLPVQIWRRLSYAWTVFFLAMGFTNLYIAYHFDTPTWVNFKLFGGAGFTFVFVLFQALYLAKHVKEPVASHKTLKKQIQERS